MRSALSIPLVDDRRARRVAELLIVLCILSLADLCFTVWAQLFTPFYEVNPLARTILNGGNSLFALVVVKVLLTAFGASIFWKLRSFWRAELGLWVVVGVYVLLAIRWNHYTAEAMLAMMSS